MSSMLDGSNYAYWKAQKIAFITIMDELLLLVGDPVQPQQRLEVLQKLSIVMVPLHETIISLLLIAVFPSTVATATYPKYATLSPLVAAYIKLVTLVWVSIFKTNPRKKLVRWV